MPKTTDNNDKKARIARFFSDVTPVPAEQPKPYYATWCLLGLSLIGTILPSQTVVAFFSLTAVVTFGITLLMILKRQAYINKSASGLLIVLLTASMLSGCRPLEAQKA